MPILDEALRTRLLYSLGDFQQALSCQPADGLHPIHPFDSARKQYGGIFEQYAEAQQDPREAPCAASSSPGSGSSRPSATLRPRSRQALRAGKSGIVFAPDYAEHGFRCRVHGQPNIVLEDHIDKRDLRFMGDGAAYTFIAMDQAVKDSGLSPRCRTTAPGIIVGSGGPSTKSFFKAHNIVRETGSAQADRPLRRDQGHVLDRLGLPCDAVQDQGRELFDHLGLLDQRALHRQRHRADPDGQAGHRLCRRGRGTGLDALVPVRRDGRDVVQVQRHARTASRTYDANRDGFVIAAAAGSWCWRSWNHALARGAKIYAEVTGYGATSDGHDMVAPSGEGGERRCGWRCPPCRRAARSTTSTATAPARSSAT
jgi:hypothetical protein